MKMKRFRLSFLATLVVALTATGIAQREVRLKPDTTKQVEVAQREVRLKPDTTWKAESVAKPESVGIASERLARVHTAMQGFVDRHQVAGVVTLIARQGEVVQLDAIGVQDLDTKRPMKPDTLFFIASMTKPITTAAVMMLYEEGKVLLTDRVSKFIPAFAHPKLTTGEARREITIRDLLTHRSGLTYGFSDDGPVGRAYRADGVIDGLKETTDTLADNIDRLAKEPLLFEPGSKWNYGLSTDVLGRVVEVVSGMPLDAFLRTRIFEPLKMRDTLFYVPDDKASRVATLYTDGPGGGLKPIQNGDKVGNNVVEGLMRRGSNRYFSGGAGLISTAPDYARFLQMLLNGGEFDGVRLLGPKTIELMTVSHTGDLMPSPQGSAAGFGLGFRVITDLGQSQRPASVGTYSWGGIWGTSFWVDPKEKVVGVMMIQRYPTTSVPIADVFQTMAYQAIVR
jgi:CubicO group peptidase (beta-lactamase class C family)